MERVRVQSNYDLETAQYLSPDPIGLAGGVRPQGYVDNPLSWADPLGLASYARVDNETLYIKNKFEPGSAEDLALRQHVENWNAQLEAAGPMTRQSVTREMRKKASREATKSRVNSPSSYPEGMVAGHTPDVAWGALLKDQ